MKLVLLSMKHLNMQSYGRHHNSARDHQSQCDSLVTPEAYDTTTGTPAVLCQSGERWRRQHGVLNRCAAGATESFGVTAKFPCVTQADTIISRIFVEYQHRTCERFGYGGVLTLGDESRKGDADGSHHPYKDL